MQIILNQSEKRFVSRLMKNGKKLIRPNPISIRINPNEFKVGLIGLKTWFRIGSDSFG